MSRKQRRTFIGEQFAPRTISMLESPPYRILSLSARRFLDRLEIELAHHGGTNNGKLIVTYADLEKYGLDRHAIGPAQREAMALGFTELTEHGVAGNAEHRRPNEWRLTYRHTADAAPTDEWRRIKTFDEAVELAKSARAAQVKQRRISVGVNTKFRCGKPPPKTKIPSEGNPHYSHTGETLTTFYISGEDTPPDSESLINDTR